MKHTILWVHPILPHLASLLDLVECGIDCMRGEHSQKGARSPHCPRRSSCRPPRCRRSIGPWALRPQW